jgi:hypothetical protein
VLALASFGEAGAGVYRTKGAGGGGLGQRDQQMQQVRHASKKRKGSNGSSIPKASGSSSRGAAASFQQRNSGPQAWGFGQLVPPMQPPMAAAGGRGGGADGRTVEEKLAGGGVPRGTSAGLDADGAHSAGPAQSSSRGLAPATEGVRTQMDASASAPQKRAGVAPAVGSSLPMTSSAHTFPRLLPVEELAYALNAHRPCVKSQWPVPGQLADRCSFCFCLCSRPVMHSSVLCGSGRVCYKVLRASSRAQALGCYLPA